VGVRVSQLGDYRFAAPGWRGERIVLPPALVLGFGNVSEEQIRRGIRSLADVVAQQASAR
jgi:GntR family transcriptional regulator/MocR family aminotransferase